MNYLIINNQTRKTISHYDKYLYERPLAKVFSRLGGLKYVIIET